jgi:hypothetical protein
MLKVVLTNFVLGNILETVNDLRKDGYRQGIDFDFAYYPEKFEGNNSFAGKIQERTVEFTFYDDELGLIFKLKSGQ